MKNLMMKAILLVSFFAVFFEFNVLHCRMYKPGKHLPLMMFIEQGESENPTKKSVGTVTGNLSRALSQKAGAVITSQKILYNLVHRINNIDNSNHPENIKLIASSLSDADWSLYQIPNSQFYLIIPKSKIADYNNAFNLPFMKKIDLPNAQPQQTNPLDQLSHFEQEALAKHLGGVTIDVIKKFEVSVQITYLSMWLASLKKTETIDQLEPASQVAYKAYIDPDDQKNIDDLKKEAPQDQNTNIQKWYIDLIGRTNIYRTGIYNNLTQAIEIHLKPQAPFSINNFKDLFKVNDVVWDIFINGHGQKDNLISNLSIPDFQELLKFFAAKLTIGVCIIATCYVGGTNLQTLTLQEEIGKKNASFFSVPNFMIIAVGVDDSPTYGSPLDYQKIFSLASELGTKNEKTLKQLLSALNTMTPQGEALHASANIPQIILPGGRFIQSLTPDAWVKVIGKVFARTKEFEKKPIEIGWGITNVLLYPLQLKTRLKIVPTHTPSLNLDMIKPQWGAIPSIYEILEKDGASIWKIVTENPAHFPTLYKLRFEPWHTTPHLIAEHKKHLYPNIISMVSSPNTTHYIESIEIFPNLNAPLKGVIGFIRDAFFDLNGRSSKKEFLINEITGPNDLILLLEAVRASKSILEPHSLEKLVQLNQQPSLKLKSVIITTEGELTYDPTTETYGSKVHGLISFEIDNSGWLLSVDKFNTNENQQAWDFKSDDAGYNFSIQKEDLDKKIEEMGGNAEAQKSIPAVLEQKKDRMRRRKEARQAVQKTIEAALQKKNEPQSGSN